MQLVSKWTEAWKWHSVQVFALLAVLPVAWTNLPPSVVAMIPEAYRPVVISLIALIGALSRLKKQG